MWISGVVAERSNATVPKAAGVQAPGGSKADDFDNICKTIIRIREEVGIEICASLGILTEETAFELKNIGVTRYHSNIETAPRNLTDQ